MSTGVTSSYTECMAVKMRSFPKGISRAERGLLFCAEAKLCSGKFTERKKAEQYCRENPPAPRAPRTGKKRGQACLTQVEPIVDCLLGKGLAEAPEQVLRTYLGECMCGKAKKTTKAEKAQAMWDAMPQEQKDALQLMEVMKGEYSTPG